MKVYDVDESGKVTDSHLEDDPFCFQKGLSKAQRNALQTIMPADFTAKCLHRFLQASGRKEIAAPPKAREPERPRPRINDKVPEPGELKSIDDLLKYAFNRWHIQPDRVYKELGHSYRADIGEEPFECYLKLKAVLEP